tara:strand:- start:373 stop:558 length:186 start_codon:yes stop_codon:yes gene_type:complete
MDIEWPTDTDLEKEDRKRKTSQSEKTGWQTDSIGLHGAHLLSNIYYFQTCVMCVPMLGMYE